VSVFPAVAEQTGIDPRLLAGEVITSDLARGEAGASVRMQLLVQAPAQAVWEVVVSCKLAYAFVDGLRACEVLEDSGDRALVRQTVRQGWLIPDYEYVFESLRRPYERIDVRLVEGNLKILDGEWTFGESAAGTLVEHRIRIQPSLPAPEFLVRRNLRHGMPDMLACIRGLADGSGSAERRVLDLRRCAGPVPEAGAPQ